MSGSGGGIFFGNSVIKCVIIRVRISPEMVCLSVLGLGLWLGNRNPKLNLMVIVESTYL